MGWGVPPFVLVSLFEDLGRPCGGAVPMDLVVPVVGLCQCISSLWRGLADASVWRTWTGAFARARARGLIVFEVPTEIRVPKKAANSEWPLTVTYLTLPSATSALLPTSHGQLHMLPCSHPTLPQP